HKNGKVSISKEYLHGELNGKVVYFNENGDSLFTSTWTDNVLNGTTIAYQAGNHRLFVENYYAGKLKANTIYLDSTGKPFEGHFNKFYYVGSKYYFRSTFCIAGRPQGNVFLYNGDNGELIKINHFNDGTVNGKSCTYWQDSIISISNYENGEFLKEEDSHYSYHIFIYNNFLKFEPNNDHFLFLRGLAYLRIGKVKHCLDDLDRAIYLNKDNYKAFYNRAVILADSLPKMAMKDLAQTLKIKKDFHLAYYNLGILYYRDAQYKKARDSFESCISLMPHHLPSIHNLSMIYGLIGDKNMQEYYRNEFERIKKKDKPKIH
ncbi:MAG: tetratricopeptide repeat protein, partial [Opitutaceae bacterium]|nr:tetratricopeptide repeat protein [Cytophagales bacterium]